ncbi:NB-ARC domain-containing protein [Streptomyces sp. NPDC047461]|uniref:ATP-binding protein n=1 Tax=Streptomyces sp. NPDC047461 TaxID=3155619 RepID=UPI0033D0DAB6
MPCERGLSVAGRMWEAGNLPTEKGELIGRQQELSELLSRCARDRPDRLVTLSGVGGVGKTRLARRAAAELQPGFRDGVWWVELSGLVDGAQLPYAIAEALPLVDQTTRPMLEVVAEYLAERELLLVLDTCEHMVDECADIVTTLLTVAPGLRVLVTSRRPFALPAEDVVTLGPLPQADAAELLVRRAGEAAVGFCAADRDEVAELCRRLDGLPLAIELAAARLRHMPLAELSSRLGDRFEVLGETEQVGHQADPPWHQSLRTTIGWSHELCSPSERLAWARLSVFAGSFDAEAARQVLTDEFMLAEDVPRLLDSLVRGSILEWTLTGTAERYRMLDTIREYGAFWLRGLGEEQAIRRRHRAHYLALARTADAAWIGPEQIDWYDRMTTEFANLRAALDCCLAEGDVDTALDMGGALWFFWYACGFAQEGRHYLDRALELERALGPAPGPVRAKALWARALAGQTMGDMETGLRTVGAFRDAVADEADETGLIAAAFMEGASLALSGRQPQAAQALDAGATHASPPHGRYDAAWYLLQVARAFVHIQFGRLAEAAAITDHLCATCDRHGETHARAWGEYVRALAALGLGRPEEAAAHARVSLDGKRRVHDSAGAATAIDLLASATVASGRAEQAARLLGLAEQIWQTLGTPQMGAPELVAARQACEAQARRLVGDDAYQAAFRKGCDTDPDAGIADAVSPPDVTPVASPSEWP